MRKRTFTISALLCGLMLSGSLLAQREIQFSYDNSGNMTSRTIYIQQSPVAPLDESANSVGQNNETANFDTTEVKKSEVFEDLIGNQQINIYPNPTMGHLVINIPVYKFNPNDRIEIIDMQGVLKMQVLTLSESNTLDISSYPAATYIMLIYINEKTTQWKIIKQ